MVQFSHPYMTTGKTIALTVWTSISKVMSLLFNTLSRFVIAFLPRKKHPEKNLGPKDTCTLIFTTALLTVAKTWKQLTCPSTEEWIQMWCMYTVKY